jgi:histidine ammonia-lyase
MRHVVLDGETLKLEEVEAVALAAPGAVQVELHPEARARVAVARKWVEERARDAEPHYGINTGFGTLAEVKIQQKDLAKLQRNLVLSHSAGVGDPLPLPEARALMLLRCNVLARGHSGIRLETLEQVVAMLNKGCVPVVPQRGSVGASGDLAPLAHLALVVIGEGEAFVGGERMAGKKALAKVGLAPVELQAKEGLALVNGTQAMTAVGGLALRRAERLAEVADLAGAMTLEGLLGSHHPFEARIQEVRGQQGQVAAAAHLRALLADSPLNASHQGPSCSKVQDPYSLRCMPQVHGAARDGITFCRGVLDREANAATDNPLVFPDKGDIVSGGNFHGQPVAMALDLLAIAVAQLGAISERRVEQLVNPSLSGLPPFLAKNHGLNSGFMMAQVTSAALVSENKILCHPACVDTIPSSAGREDHVSMGMAAALKARQVVDHVRTCLAIELLVAAQAIDLRAPLRPAKKVAEAHAQIRSKVPTMNEDRELHRDIAAVCALVDSGALAQG